MEELRSMIQSILQNWKDSGVQIVSFIRHPSTVRVLSEAIGIDLQPNSGLYEHQPGDIVFIVTLKKPPRGREVEVKLEDLDIYLVTVEWGQ